MPWRTTPKHADKEAVRVLVADTGFFSQDEQDFAVELVDEALSYGPGRGYSFVFADAPDAAGTLLGYTCFGPIPATQSSYDLYWIAVSPSRQGKGLGTRLIMEAERIAGDGGATQMFVDTSGRRQYASTRAFYESVGYRRIAVLPGFFAPNDDKVIYVKNLPAPPDSA